MNRRIIACFLSFLILSVSILPGTVNAQKVIRKESGQPVNQWKGKRVAFLGDSITDKQRLGTEKCYWDYLAEMLGIEPLVYGISGHEMNHIHGQAEQLLRDEKDNVDAIIIFAGTNDFNMGAPIGEWYTESDAETFVGGTSQPQKVVRKHRQFIIDSTTFKGRINRAMDYLKTNFPDAQIILLTPLHRAQAQFSKDNVQPEETFQNKVGLYIDDYVNAIKEASNVWSVPVIDLNGLSGLFPLNDSHARFFANEKTDRLHPNAKGHYRIALTMKYQLLALPATFR